MLNAAISSGMEWRGDHTRRRPLLGDDSFFFSFSSAQNETTDFSLTKLGVCGVFPTMPPLGSRFSRTISPSRKMASSPINDDDRGLSRQCTDDI